MFFGEGASLLNFTLNKRFTVITDLFLQTQEHRKPFVEDHHFKCQQTTEHPWETDAPDAVTWQPSET